MNVNKKRLLMKSLLTFHFGCHSRNMANRIKRIHERALNTSKFIFGIYILASIYLKNIQFLAKEIFKANKVFRRK